MMSEYEIRNQEAIRNSLDFYRANPYWNGIYESAPSSLCARYIALDYHYSDTEDEDLLPVFRQFENEMTVGDLRYMLRNARGPEKARYMKLLQEKENS